VGACITETKVSQVVINSVQCSARVDVGDKRLGESTKGFGVDATVFLADFSAHCAIAVAATTKITATEWWGQAILTGWVTPTVSERVAVEPIARLGGKTSRFIVDGCVPIVRLCARLLLLVGKSVSPCGFKSRNGGGCFGQVECQQYVVLEEWLQCSCSLCDTLDQQILDQVTLQEFAITDAELSAALDSGVVDALTKQAVGISLARNRASAIEDSFSISGARVWQAL
jgi:hypothetical protein